MGKYTTTEWRKRRTTKANTFTKIANEDGSFTHIPEEGTVFEAGTPINDTNMNNIGMGILNGFEKLNWNGVDVPISDLSGFDNVQDMLSEVNSNIFKAHAAYNNSVVVNLPMPLSKFWLVRYSGVGQLRLKAINGVDLTTSEWTAKQSVTHQSFGDGLDSVSFSSVTGKSYGLEMFSTWMSTSQTVSDSVPPATATAGNPDETTSEGYFFNHNYLDVADNKMIVYCTGHSSDDVGAHNGKGMSYFTTAVYSDINNSFIEDVTSMTFDTNGGFLNIEVLQAKTLVDFNDLIATMEVKNGNIHKK